MTARSRLRIIIRNDGTLYGFRGVRNKLASVFVPDAYGGYCRERIALHRAAVNELRRKIGGR